MAQDRDADLGNWVKSKGGKSRVAKDETLVNVDLRDTPVTDADMQYLAKYSSRIRWLHLANTKITSAGLVHLKGMTNLQILVLDNTAIDNAGLENLKGMTKLQALFLFHTPISDAGLVYLKDLKPLQKLRLDSTKVTDAGLVHLKGLENLNSLDLSNTVVTDAGLDHLKGLINLHSVNTEGTKASKDALAYLTKARANTENSLASPPSTKPSLKKDGDTADVSKSLESVNEDIRQLAFAHLRLHHKASIEKTNLIKLLTTRAQLYEAVGNNALAQVDRQEIKRLKGGHGNTEPLAFLAVYLNDSEQLRKHAISQLSSLGKPAVYVLREALKKTRADSHTIPMVECLVQIGRDARDAVPDLIHLSGRRSVRARLAIFDALAKLAPDDKMVFATFKDALDDKDARVREKAMSVLQLKGEAAAQAIPKVAELLKDESSNVRLRAAYALLAFGKQAQQVSPQLRGALGGNDPQVRLVVAITLRRLGETVKLDPPLTPAVDLQAMMTRAGFPARGLLIPELVTSYAAYGSPKLETLASRGDQFARADVRRMARAHRKAISKIIYAIRGLPVQVADRDDFQKIGILVVCKIPMRLDVNDEDASRTEGASGQFSDKLERVYPNWTTGEEIWFLTKDGKLRQCRTSEEVEAVRRANGILYTPDGPTTDLILRLRIDEKEARQLARKASDYVVDLVIDRIMYEESRDWGYYNRDQSFTYGGDSKKLIRREDLGGREGAPPSYFRPKDNAPLPLVKSELVSVHLKRRQGGIIASYRRKHNYGDVVVIEPDSPLFPEVSQLSSQVP
jgi:HEAT repeat protein